MGSTNNNFAINITGRQNIVRANGLPVYLSDL